jgi:methyl-accepting chemotaxis protein
MGMRESLKESAVEQQADAARAIAGNVNAAATGVDCMSLAVSEIETIAGNTAAAVSQVSSAAHAVANQTSTIRARVRNFTQEVHALRA